jgi:3-deoxy-D-arabino-heptulosonate 7-phosphate (DAHP) synthase
MTGGVFISYRREDSGGFAGRIYDRLSNRLGRENVFFASAGDRECRMQLFPKMVEALSATSGVVNINSGNCSIAVNGSAAGNSISCGAQSGARAVSGRVESVSVPNALKM